MSTKDSQELLLVSKLTSSLERALTQNPKAEIFPFDYEGERVWVKRARKTGSNLFHTLVYAWSKNPILSPVEKKSASAALLHESSKLQNLKQMQIPVPKVITVREDCFVIEDCGPTVHHLIKYKETEEPQALILQTLQALARLHKEKQYHGGSQIKNFTTKDDTIYFIDFEESFSQDVALEDLQFRDLFLFLFSVSKLKIEIDYQQLIEAYVSVSGKKEILTKFYALSNSVSWLMKLLQNKTVWKLVDRDTQSV
ncbi:MAG: hypothetical protein GQ531_00630, partial [Sulfurovum sp.]|nr:hypothetical protein [Sulfurovum sp.]